MIELNKNEQQNNYDQQPKKGNALKRIAIGLLVFALIILIIGFSAWVITTKKQSENKLDKHSGYIDQQTEDVEKTQEQNARDIFSQRSEKHERKVICGDGICDLPEMVKDKCPDDCGNKALEECATSETETICGDGVCGLLEMANKNCPLDCDK